MSLHIRIGGVPEHYNLPWRLAIEEGAFASLSAAPSSTVEWIDLPGGTGEIMEALATGRVDLATPLTEGAVTAIANGNPSELVSTWVDSPLDWGVFAAGGSSAETVADLEGNRFAISRYGSGSELMSLVMADEYGWTLTETSFVVVGGLEGAIEALPAGDAEIFMWDKTMTQPHVDSGVFKLVGGYPTPWPGFAVAQSAVFAQDHGDLALELTQIASRTAADFKDRSDADQLIMDRYGLDHPEVSDFLSTVRWTSPDVGLDQEMVARVQAKMKHVGRINS